MVLRGRIIPTGTLASWEELKVAIRSSCVLNSRLATWERTSLTRHMLCTLLNIGSNMLSKPATRAVSLSHNKVTCFSNSTNIVFKRVEGEAGADAATATSSTAKADK